MFRTSKSFVSSGPWQNSPLRSPSIVVQNYLWPSKDCVGYFFSSSTYLRSDGEISGATAAGPPVSPAAAYIQSECSRTYARDEVDQNPFQNQTQCSR